MSFILDRPDKYLELTALKASWPPGWQGEEENFQLNTLESNMWKCAG